MSDYGISQNQPIQRYNYPVVGKKKENKQENMQKAATCTLATVAGVVLTMLVGYGIVNKGGSAKKVVDGAKKGAQEVARKKNTESSISNINTMFKSLEKINNGETLDSKDIKAEIDILTVYKTTIFIPQVNQHISSYIRLLEQVLNDNPNSKNIDKDKYEKIFTNKNKGKIKIDEILALTQKEKELKEKLAQQQLDFEDLTLNGENKITKNGHSIEIKESFDDLDKFSNLVQLRYNIYYDSKDDGTIYIFKDEKYHKVNISELVNLNPIKKNNGHKFLDPSQVNYIDKTAAVENVTIDGNNIQCIKGVKKADTDTDTDLYIKVRDLTENAIATIVNTDASQLDNRDGILNAINANCSSETIGKVLANDDLKDKLVDASGNPTDAGTTLITGWVTSNNDKANNIASALKEIKEFGDKSVGAAFVNAIKAKCSSETIGQVLANAGLKDKLVDTTTGDLKDAGDTLITGWVTSNNDKAKNIASALNEIKAFGANSVGAAFVNAIKAKCKPATIGQVLDKLVDASGNPTDAGTTLITGWVTSNKKNVDGIASALKEINEFGDNSVGAAFVNAINAKCEPGTIKRILTNLFGTNKDIEITSDSKEQLLLDVLFTKISLSEFETFIKGAKIKTYILKDKTYKDSISVQDSVFKLKIKTYTKLYFSSKEGTYDDETPSFEKYLLQQCGIDTTTIHNTEYNKIYIDDSKDKEQKIKLSLNAYKDDELVETKDNKLLLTGAAMNLISTHCTGDNNLDELKYDKVKQEEPNSNWSFRKKGNKEDSTITISGITFKYYVEPDTDTLYIRRAKHQPQP